MATSPLKTRYLVIRLDIPDATFSNGKTTKYIHAYSGSPLVDGYGYAKVDAVITNTIGYQDNAATIIIHGMSESDVNTFTRTNLYGFIDMQPKNLITVYAGYNLGSDGLPPLIYCGFVTQAAPDFNLNRDRPLIIHSIQFFDTMNINIKPTNIQGVISLDNLFRYICNQEQYVYRGFNVTGNARNPILTGSFREQLQQATTRYGYQLQMSRSPTESQNIVYISPKGQPFNQTPVILSAQNNEMIGYPKVEMYGFSVKCYFNPQLSIGQSIQVNSVSVPLINNKNLYINQMIHELHNREEPWQSTLQLNLWTGGAVGVA